MTLAAAAAPAALPDVVGRVGARLICGLIAGRATFRLILYGANVALLAGWGAHTYARYAAASGALGWVVALAQAGPEKAALKLIPRDGVGRPAIVAGLRALIRFAPLAVLAPAALAIAVDPRAGVALYAVAAAQSVAIGLNMAAVAVQRALGRITRDLMNFGLLSVAWILLTVIALAFDVQPALYLLCLCVATVTVSEVTMSGTPLSPTGATDRSPALRSLAETGALMGVYDIAGMAAGSVAFLVLPLTAQSNQSGVLYLALAGWGLALSLFTYVARVFQPRLSVWLAGEGRVKGRHQARALAVWSVGLNAVWLVVVALLIVVADMRSLAPGISAVAILTVLLLSRGVIWGLTFASVSLLENADVGALRVVARAAAAGFAVVAMTSIAVIPEFGAAGAIWALATDELALGAIVVFRLRASGP